MFRQPGRYKYIAGMAPVPPRTIWIFDDDFYEFKETIGYYAPVKNPSRSMLERVVKKILTAFEIDEIAVELSGGLDTSLIIEVLLAVGVKVKLFGLESHDYAFRTERYIQEYYKSKVTDCICLSSDECLPLSNLIEVPAHPFPNATNLTYERQKRTIASMRALGVNILLNGDAGDHLLCHSFSSEEGSTKLPDSYKKWSLMEDWVNQAVYEPHGISYLSACALPAITRILWSMRRGQPEDFMKLWARALYADRLPRELSAYAYKASHDGWFAKSVAKAADQIYEVSSKANGLFPNENLRPDVLVKSAHNYERLPHSEKLNFMARVSYATWIFGLAREGYIA